MVAITLNRIKAQVTFTVVPTSSSTSATLCGEWNNWEALPMKKKKDGGYFLRVSLTRGKSYQFGYDVDGLWCCDDTLPLVESPLGTQNSLLAIE